MMKVTFEEILEYLESGNDDPAFERRIEDDPDGRRLRDEAELFLKLLRDCGKDEDDEGDADAHEKSITKRAALSPQAKLPLDAADDTFEFGRMERRVSPKAAMRTADLAAGAAGAVHELGVLEVTSTGPDLELVFHSDVSMYEARRNFDTFSSHLPSKREDKAPSRANQHKFGRQLMSSIATELGGSKRRIRGRGIEVRLPDRVDLSGPIRLEVRDTRINVPARGVEIVLMPESRPYSRLLTNSKGIVDLPVPDGPGVLRIETTPPQTVRIEVNIS